MEATGIKGSLNPNAGLSALTHTGPIIPEEWSRENGKTAAKMIRSKQSSLVEIERSANNSPTDKRVDSTERLPEIVPPIPPTTTRNKRKRASAKGSARVPDADATGVPNENTHRSTVPAAAAVPPICSPPEVQLVTGAALDDRAERVSSRNAEETESVLRGLYHQVEKLSRRPGCALSEGIYLDSIMTHIPYIEVLQQMFGGDSATSKPSVPLVTRAYEESYMREVVGSTEESCVMGHNCECQFVDEHNPFVGVQFTLPVERFVTHQDAIDPELMSNKLCVLCCRKNTQALFYDALYNHRACNGCIQLYGNICDRPGEYATEAMLICPLSGPINNMPIPVVAHQRNRYSVVVHNGVRQLRQHRVGYEDFRMPSSSRC